MWEIARSATEWRALISLLQSLSWFDSSPPRGFFFGVTRPVPTYPLSPIPPSSPTCSAQPVSDLRKLSSGKPLTSYIAQAELCKSRLNSASYYSQVSSTCRSFLSPAHNILGLPPRPYLDDHGLL